MVFSQILLFPLLAVAWSVFGGVSSYGVPQDASSKGFHQPITSVTAITPTLNTAASPSSLEKNSEEEEPSDYEIMSAIARSLEEWREKQERKNSHVHRRSVDVDVEVVCYEPFGCFNNTGHFDHLILPQAPEVIGTRFILYTRDQPEGDELLCLENTGSQHTCKFNAARPFKVIIHGFSNSGGCAWVQNMTEALLDQDDINVIVVDWKNGASLLSYTQAATNAQLVGRQLARLLEQLHVQMQVDYNNVHLIGFSLGAHVAGYAGLQVKGLGRITGLDPANPLFNGNHENVRLDPTDAKFVDVIHTNGDEFPRGLGIFEPMGHMDFYPNGGQHQPGCGSVLVGIVKYYIKGSWEALCSHRRAIEFFTESIKPSCSFTAFPCDNYEKFVGGHCFHCPPSGCPNMGFDADRIQETGGNYFLLNRDIEPFCVYQKKIEVSSSQGKGYTYGNLDLVFHDQGMINETFHLMDTSQIIKDDEQIQQIVITQPEFQMASEVSVLYSKKKGWWSSGTDNWYLDKISISDTTGNRYSYCGFETEFKDSEMRTLPLIAGDCSPQLI